MTEDESPGRRYSQRNDNPRNGANRAEDNFFILFILPRTLCVRVPHLPTPCRFSLILIEPCLHPSISPQAGPLLRRVLHKLHALLDIPLQALIRLDEQLLLVLIRRRDDVLRLEGTVLAELDRHGEVLETGLLGDSVTAGHTGQVHERGLDDAGLALGGADDFLGEAEARVRHREGSGAGAVLGLDDFVAAELDAWGGRET